VAGGEPLILAEGLRKVYRMGRVEVHALRGVNLQVRRREFLAIVGPSGSGKSTLLHCIGCLDTPTGGRVLIDGVDTSKLDGRALAKLRRERIGFVFQQFNLIRSLNAVENVALPMVFAGVRRAERLKVARSLLEKVGLGDRLHHKPSELSGGEQQRVAIARALANDPEIIMADEPTGNLDSEVGGVIMDIFKELNDEGRTIIVVTHNPEVARRARRTVRMKDGKINE